MPSLPTKLGSFAKGGAEKDPFGDRTTAMFGAIGIVWLCSDSDITNVLSKTIGNARTKIQSQAILSLGAYAPELAISLSPPPPYPE